jgi:hypothetical protein
MKGTQRKRAAREAVAQASAAPPPAVFDVQAQRRALGLKLIRFAADWRRCPQRRCRRARSCGAPGDVCHAPPRGPARQMTEEQWAREKASLKRALDRRLAALRGSP